MTTERTLRITVIRRDTQPDPDSHTVPIYDVILDQDSGSTTETFPMCSLARAYIRGIESGWVSLGIVSVNPVPIELPAETVGHEPKSVTTTVTLRLWASMSLRKELYSSSSSAPPADLLKTSPGLRALQSLVT